MKFGSRLLASLGISMLALAAAPTMAACTWNGSDWTPKQLTLNGGAVFAPRDVPVGSTLNTTGGIRELPFGDRLVCGLRATYSTALVGPVVNNIPVDTISVPANSILQTSVPGVGLAMYMTGFATQWQMPVGNPSRFIPFTLSLNIPTATSGMPSAMVRYALIKTGEIPPGAHSINQLVATGSSDRGHIWDLTFTATVTVAGCSMPAAPGNQIDVPMGHWEKRVFNGKNSTTQAQPFEITLNSCIAGNNYPSNTNGYFNGNFANIQIDGHKTSTIIDAANGVLSLSSDSTAQGVAIQILRDNGTPMNLGLPVRLNRVANGITSIPLRARYIQTGGGPTPQPGTANGYASFTVTYR
ncbi:type 1 fimbrial protein [Pseudomonas sp. SWRI153]|uniref:Type 1 fimbrial protein n=1 Tax=Pseudomonas khorasanensis TaxID=2745508 RepID=A0A923JGT2_9PSED|nr:fimbrial protein [Pseudomonas khorasanensis]MBV4487867.1 type 1 fimbrial protein [Pseudomonas khorasanensis]